MHEPVQQHLQHGGDDPTAPGTARRQQRPAIAVEDQRWGHRTEGAALRSDGVLTALAQAIGIGRPGLGREVIHLVVEQEAGTRHGDAIAVGRVQGGGRAHHAPITVHHREVGGVRAAVERQGFRFEFGGGAMAIQPDPLPLLIGIAAAEETIQGHRHLIRIPQQSIAIPVRQVHRLDHPVDRRRTVEPRGLQLQRLQDVEQLQQGGATATGWGHGQDRIALELTPQRTHPRGPVAL